MNENIDKIETNIVKTQQCKKECSTLLTKPLTLDQVNERSMKMDNAVKKCMRNDEDDNKMDSENLIEFQQFPQFESNISKFNLEFAKVFQHTTQNLKKLIQKNQQPPNVWKGMRNKDATFVIVLGKTGIGKSSIIRLLTKAPFIQNVNSDYLCAQETLLYPQRYNDSNVIFVDTISEFTEGSEQKKIDKYLNDIQQKIHENNGTKVKFIWVIPDEIRSTGYLKTQAKFINQFGIHPDTYHNIYNNNNDEIIQDGFNNIDEIKQDDINNIWDSVLMIISKPSVLSKLEDGAKGAICASIKYCAQAEHWKAEKNLIGFTNIDWITKNELSEDDDATNEFNIIKSICNDKKQKGLYYYYNSKDIEDMIFKCLSDKNITPFNIIFKNYKCNICQVISDPRFINDKKCHSNRGIYKRHPINTKPQIKHVSKITDKTKTIHWGKLMHVHTQPPHGHYHPDELKLSHPKSLSITTFGKLIGGSYLAIAFATNNSDMAARTLHYPCCNADGNSAGCQLLYQCCKGDKNSKGCQKTSKKHLIYPCCDRPYTAPGCHAFYQCCEKDKGSIGCQVLCDACRGVLKDENANSKRCGYIWPCCSTYGKITDDNDPKQNNGIDGCKDACRYCRGILGESEGCTSYPVAKHDMRPM